MTEKTITPDFQEPKNKISRKRALFYLATAGFLVAGIIILVYMFKIQNRVYVEKSQILSTSIELSSRGGGVLEKLFVSAGDEVRENTPVAQIGNDIVKTREAGRIILVQDNIGKTFSPGEAVATMIRPGDLHVVAQTEEDKGLSSIKIGQKATFTVDTYGSKKYFGIVDEVSPTARQNDLVFNISSQRQMNEFNVKIRFDHEKYPELSNGMSAKVWIYTE